MILAFYGFYCRSRHTVGVAVASISMPASCTPAVQVIQLSAQCTKFFEI